MRREGFIAVVIGDPVSAGRSGAPHMRVFHTRRSRSIGSTTRGPGMERHVLIIDDEQSVRDAFALALGSSGYSVETAERGEDGLRKAREHHPDLVFLDLRMPGIGGIETLRQLQQVCRGTPVYVVTAFYLTYLEPLRALQAEGITFQLAKKPLSADDIREITRSVFEGPEARLHD